MRKLTIAAVLIIVALILVALYSFGVFEPQGQGVSNQSAYQSCVFNEGFGGGNIFIYSNGTTSVTVSQNTGSDINITAVGCNTADKETNMTVLNRAITLRSGESATLLTKCYSDGAVFTSQPGSLFAGYILVNYTDLTGGYTNTATAEVVGKSS
jgi:hypothetical protein